MTLDKQLRIVERTLSSMAAAWEAARLRKKNKGPLCCKILLRLPDLDHSKNSMLKHFEFAKFEAQLQVCNGAIYYLVLLRTAAGTQPFQL